MTRCCINDCEGCLHTSCHACYGDSALEEFKEFVAGHNRKARIEWARSGGDGLTAAERAKYDAQEAEGERRRDEGAL